MFTRCYSRCRTEIIMLIIGACIGGAAPSEGYAQTIPNPPPVIPQSGDANTTDQRPDSPLTNQAPESRSDAAEPTENNSLPDIPVNSQFGSRTPSLSDSPDAGSNTADANSPENALTAKAPVISRIQAKKIIRIGINGSFPPFSFRDQDGKLIGLEVDLGQLIAGHFGVSSEFVEVSDENRVVLLQNGTIDLIISGYQESDERYGSPALVEPAYYRSGYAVIGRKEVPLKAWRGLSEFKVCAVKNMLINIIAQRKYQLNLTTFADIYEAEQNLLAGQFCEVWLFDEVYLKNLMNRSDWRDYRILLTSQERIAWHIAIDPDSGNADFAGELSNLITDWFRGKTLSKLEWKWRLPYSAYVMEMESVSDI